MRLTALSLLLVGYILAPASGWGIFNRFRPEATGWGYGGAGMANSRQERPNTREQLLQTLMGEGLLEEENCAGRRCSVNANCCEGHICVGFDTSVSGVCMATSSHRLTMECSSDSECKDGFICELGECTPLNDKKIFNEKCQTSSECDASSGLCCQLVRRHRQAPRKVCDYYQDPMKCIGLVEGEAMKRSLGNQ